MVVKLEVTVPSYAIVYDKKRLRAVLRSAGNEIASLTRSLLRHSTGGGRKGASVPGQPPASLSGTLAGSIKSKLLRSGDGVSIRDMAWYALFLEHGAKGPGKRVLQPRPFLSLALDQSENSISERIKRAVMEDIKFERKKYK